MVATNNLANKLGGLLIEEIKNLASTHVRMRCNLTSS
jgi:hypothetical protein